MSLAPYMSWAKQHVRQRLSLSGSNLLHCELDDLPGAREALEPHGDNDNGFRLLVDAIASTYGVTPEMVAVAQGTSGANFLVFAALVKAGDDVLAERPGYDPLMGPPALLGARIVEGSQNDEGGTTAVGAADSHRLTWTIDGHGSSTDTGLRPTRRMGVARAVSKCGRPLKPLHRGPRACSMRHPGAAALKRRGDADGSGQRCSIRGCSDIICFVFPLVRLQTLEGVMVARTVVAFRLPVPGCAVRLAPSHGEAQP